MTIRHVALVGSGSLARSLCHSLADLAPIRGRFAATPPLRVTLLARNEAAVDGIARACGVRAAVAGTAVTFAAESLGDETATLARLRPDVLVCCASAQSPYERATAPSPWTDLIARAGFGLTLPLQAAVAVRLARAVARVSADTLVVNGCFPDAVNPLLAALGLPVHCGIGNVATLAACLQAALDLPDQRDLAVLGHHAHLAPPDGPPGDASGPPEGPLGEGSGPPEGLPGDGSGRLPGIPLGSGHAARPDDGPLGLPGDDAGEVRAWCRGRPLSGVTALLAPARALPRRDLNAIAGHAAAQLLASLASGAQLHTSLPGPGGLPGGYPVRVSSGGVALDLPDGLTAEAAIAWNVRAGRRDGVEVSGRRVSYPPWAAAAIAAHLPDLADGWPADALDDVSDRLMRLRQRLRLAQPVPVGSPR